MTTVPYVYREEGSKTRNAAQSLIEQGGVKSNKFWKIARNLRKPVTEECDLITEDDRTIKDPVEAKEYIHSYFTDLYSIRNVTPEYQQWDDLIHQENLKHIEEATQNRTERNFTIKELDEAIAHAKNNKAVGPDGIPNEFIKNADLNVRSYFLNILNKIASSDTVPESWRCGNLIRIYKGKGTLGKCSSDRGITLASNMGKIYERLLNNRAQKKLFISDAQAGGKKGRSTTDHILAVKELVSKKLREKKTVIIALLDVKKAYDKAFLAAILYNYYNRGVTGQLWNQLRILNTDLKVTVQTNHGPTEPVLIGGSIGQGKINSGPFFAAQMDDIPMEIEQRALGIQIDTGEHVGAFAWMDDVIIVSDDSNEMQEMLNIANHVAKKYHMEYGEDKSQIMIIGNKDDIPTFTLGDLTLETTEKYKYLGVTLNSKWNLDDHIKAVKGKVEAAYQTILSIAQDRSFKGMQMEVMWKLLESCILPVITYAAATWNCNKNNLKALTRIYEGIIKRILMTATSTPSIAIYAETGLLDMEHIEMKERLTNERRIDDNDNLLLKKILDDKKSNWRNHNCKIAENLGLDRSETFSARSLKTEVQQKVADHMKSSWLQKGREQSKFIHLTRGKVDEHPFTMKKYMLKLNRFDLSTIFKARTRMLDVKTNFKNRHKNNLRCRLCKLDEETQAHVLQYCPELHEDDTTKISYEDIYENEDMPKLRAVANKIRDTMDKMEDLENNGN